MSETGTVSAKRMITFRHARNAFDAAIFANAVEQNGGDVFSITGHADRVYVWFRVDSFDHASRIDHEIGKMTT